MNDEIKNLLDRMKEVASSAGETAGQYLNTAGRKANVLWDLTRCNMQIMELRGSIDKLYREIGALVYKTHMDPETSSEGLPDKLAELERLHDKINELESQIESSKTRRVCPVCSQSCDKADIFCRSCGHAFRKNAEKEQETE